MKRKITDILEDMDKLDEIEITDELVDILKDHFKEEISNNDHGEDEQVAKGINDLIIGNRGKTDNGQQDRV